MLLLQLQLMLFGVLGLVLLVEAGGDQFTAVRGRLGQVHDAAIEVTLELLLDSVAICLVAALASPDHDDEMMMGSKIRFSSLALSQACWPSDRGARSLRVRHAGS